MRFIIRATNLVKPSPWITYVANHSITASPEGALIMDKLSRAKEVTDEWRRCHPTDYLFTIEKLARGGMKQAFLHSEEIEY